MNLEADVHATKRTSTNSLREGGGTPGCVTSAVRVCAPSTVGLLLCIASLQGSLPLPLTRCAGNRGQSGSVFPRWSSVPGTPDVFPPVESDIEIPQEESHGSILSNSALVAGNVSFETTYEWESRPSSSGTFPKKQSHALLASFLSCYCTLYNHVDVHSTTAVPCYIPVHNHVSIGYE